MSSGEPSYEELLKGIPADPDTFELVVKDCTATVGSHIDYEIELTNLDDKQRAFAVDVMVRDTDGEFRKATRAMPKWIYSGETLPLKAWVGWDDAYDPTPVCDFVILRSSFEGEP